MRFWQFGVLKCYSADFFTANETQGQTVQCSGKLEKIKELHLRLRANVHDSRIRTRLDKCGLVEGLPGEKLIFLKIS